MKYLTLTKEQVTAINQFAFSSEQQLELKRTKLENGDLISLICERVPNGDIKVVWIKTRDLKELPF